MLRSGFAVGLVFVCLFASSVPVGAFDWPEIPASEKALTQVSGQPNAPAVILAREGFVHLSENRKSSYVEVYARIKILNEEGVEFGSVELESSDFLRTKNIAGRTHLPDGRIAVLSDDAIFERKFSDYYNSVIVSSALPEVVPGAIIEYSYRTYFDSIFLPREWYFQSAIPTLKSRVTFEMPKTVSYYPIEFNRLNQDKIPRSIDENVAGGQVTYILENIPPVADEPYSFPFDDLVTKVLLIPGADHSTSIPAPLFDSWESILNHYYGVGDDDYNGFKSSTGSAKKQAKLLAKSATGKRQQATAIYDWVRDEIDVEPYVGLFVGDPRADQIFKSRKGSHGEKATLLKIMLQTAGIDARVAWENPRDEGRTAANVPNPLQFSEVIVVADVGGDQVFLDPSDRRNAFGILSPTLRGTQCFVIGPKKRFEWVTISALEPEDSERVATLDYTLDPEGSLNATGRLELTGGRAWHRLQWKDSTEETAIAWKTDLESSFPGFDIDDVEVTELAAGPSVTVSWIMNQREEEILGDESGIGLASPIGLSSNPFTLTANRRSTPVQFEYPRTDRVVTTINWPEGWVIAGEPTLKVYDGSAGHLTTSSEIDHDARRAVFEREFVIAQMEIMSSRDYSRLRSLFATTVSSDSSGLLLITE